jgi:hypothetical protein
MDINQEGPNAVSSANGGSFTIAWGSAPGNLMCYRRGALNARLDGDLFRARCGKWIEATRVNRAFSAGDIHIPGSLPQAQLTWRPR